ncbi:hypothetical protein [Oscillibacter sp.]|uniref:hypothetical protein n=1 Tax=Oscillibacter sp. TaxID=1945593 RepID=UPI00261C2DED|nr:hypothetical protein [Oscillibacter sp.]MDD3346560.1 hypothetical protein [Oscillibacter sp.]
MKQRIFALLLALALGLSLCGVSALAEEASGAAPAAETASAADAQTEDAAQTGETAGTAETAEAGENAETTLAGPDAEKAETGESLTDAVTIAPDAVGTLSFANLERRIRENNLQLLALEESIRFLADMDYDDLSEQLRDQISNIGKAKHFLTLSQQGDSYTYEQLQQATTALRDQLDDIKDGKLQKDNAATKRQLENLQDQIVMGGEKLYVALLAMDTQESALERQLAALNRTVEEMELRYRLGQVSALTLEQTKAGRSALVSGLDTLSMNIQNYKLQLELLIGADQTGTIKLGAIPAVTQAQLGAMDREKDLAAAKEKSYEMLAASKTLEDAKKSYDDVGVDTGYRESKLEFRQAKSAWQAAQYTYNAAVQDYELRFGTLYAQVLDYRQILSAAQVSLSCEQSAYAAKELKYQQGALSQNALLDAKDTLRAAEKKVSGASDDLFSAYNSYCWAVQHGILN